MNQQSTVCVNRLYYTCTCIVGPNRDTVHFLENQENCRTMLNERVCLIAVILLKLLLITVLIVIYLLKMNLLLSL